MDQLRRARVFQNSDCEKKFYRDIFQIKKEQKLQSYIGRLRGWLIEYIELLPCMHKNQKDDKLRHD